MAVPKRKVSKSRLRMRKASHKHRYPTATPCSNCGAARQPHHVCPNCGFYRGRQVLTVEAE